MKVQQANADGIRFIKEAGADEAVLRLKSLEAFAQAADGKATKIIIPSDIQGIAGLVKSIAEVGAKNQRVRGNRIAPARGHRLRGGPVFLRGAARRNTPLTCNCYH